MAEWKGTVTVAAAPSVVYSYLKDFSQASEWDTTVQRVELENEGDASGVGAKWKMYEKIDSMKGKNPDPDHKSVMRVDKASGIAMREINELDQDTRIAWHSYVVPRMGVTSDCAFDLSPSVDGGTQVIYSVKMNVPLDAVVGKLSRMIFRGIDAKQQALWQGSLDNVKLQVERQPVMA